jgi:2-dehydro-3-deoxyphosphooctonate aldolase (KDO 8-P synthase)
VRANIGGVAFANDLPFALIAGPCVMEGRDHALEMAQALKEVAAKLGVGFVYKTSFDKANRTSALGARGVGLDYAISVFAAIKDLGIPVITDVHEREQCIELDGLVDALQIPAFLCRQTDLLIEAALCSGCAINIKKGQFLAPWDMEHVVAKVRGAGNDNVLVTERGACFGYNTLVSDMRSLPIMSQYAPVIFDATHSVQQPGGRGASSGGRREFVPVLARAAVAVGVAGVFIETHQDPDNAPSDGPNMLHLKDVEPLLRDLVALDGIAKRAN